MSDKDKQKTHEAQGANNDKPREKLPPVPLSVMIGQGIFTVDIKEMVEGEDGLWEYKTVRTEKYFLRPVKAKEVDEFKDDLINTHGPQFLNFFNDMDRAKTEKWVSRLLFKDGKPMNIERIKEDGWEVDEDMKNLWKAILKISG